MAGHSKWSKVKHIKAVVDVRRNKLFSKLAKAITVAADLQSLTYIPETTVALTDEQTAQQVIRHCDALEDNDDVQHVHANFDVPEDIAARISL